MIFMRFRFLLETFLVPVLDPIPVPAPVPGPDLFNTTFYIRSGTGMHYGSGSAKAKRCDSAIPAPGGKGENFDDNKNSCMWVVSFFLFKNSSPYD